MKRAFYIALILLASPLSANQQEAVGRHASGQHVDLRFGPVASDPNIIRATTYNLTPAQTAVLKDYLVGVGFAASQVAGGAAAAVAAAGAAAASAAGGGVGGETGGQGQQQQQEQQAAEKAAKEAKASAERADQSAENARAERRVSQDLLAANLEAGNRLARDLVEMRQIEQRDGQRRARDLITAARSSGNVTAITTALQDRTGPSAATRAALLSELKAPANAALLSTVRTSVSQTLTDQTEMSRIIGEIDAATAPGTPPTGTPPRDPARTT